MTYHILVSDNVDRKAVELLETTPGLTVTAPGSMSREQVLAAIPAADALLIRSATRADAELIQVADRLKIIARAGVGVDNVDLEAATARGIIVMNTPDGNTIAAAEMTMGLMIALSRFIPRSYAAMCEGRWDRQNFMGVELRGKTLGLIGFGRIGRAVAKRARAFEMNVVAYDPTSTPEIAATHDVDPVDLNTLYEVSDFISLHCVLTADTRGMINTQTIARMKPGVRIINTARGALINDADLAEAIRSGRVAGAALDVYQQEPPPADHPLIGLDQVIHTPHLGASTSDAQIQVGIDAAAEIIDALFKGDYRNVVNPAVLRDVSST